jgi:hypothetical protein
MSEVEMLHVRLSEWMIFWEKGWVPFIEGDFCFLKSASAFDPENTGVVDERGKEFHMRLEWE